MEEKLHRSIQENLEANYQDDNTTKAGRSRASPPTMTSRGAAALETGDHGYNYI